MLIVCNLYLEFILTTVSSFHVHCRIAAAATVIAIAAGLCIFRTVDAKNWHHGATNMQQSQCIMMKSTRRQGSAHCSLSFSH